MTGPQSKNRALIFRAILLSTGLFTGTLMVPGAACGQADEPVELESLPEAVAAGFDQTLSNIALQDEDIRELQARADSNEGLGAQVLKMRRDRISVSMFQSSLEFAKEFADHRDDGEDVSEYQELLIARLSTLPQEAIVAIQRSRSRISFPTAQAPPEEFVIDDLELFKQVASMDALYGSLISF